MKVTRNHDEILRWSEAFAGRPMVFDNPEAGADHPGLRIDFPGLQDDQFLPEGNPPHDVSWEEFFRMFDQLGLVFEYEDTASDVADPSLLYRFRRAEAV